MSVGAFRFDYPNPTAGTPEEQIQQLRDFLIRTVDELNMVLDRLEAVEREEDSNADH